MAAAGLRQKRNKFARTVSAGSGSLLYATRSQATSLSEPISRQVTTSSTIAGSTIAEDDEHAPLLVPGRDGRPNGYASFPATTTNEGNTYGNNQPPDPKAKFTQHQSVWIRWPAEFYYTTKAVLLSDYVNFLLVFVPLGIVSGALGWDPVKIFVLNFIAIIPLAAMLAFATEELSAKLGQTIGGLLNATFGNAVELIVSIIALREGQIRIVQASMLGSILSNLLLVLGCCFIAGGVRHLEQEFDATVAQTMASLMAVASVSLIIPAALYSALSQKPESPEDPQTNILILSRGTAVVMLCLYLFYLFFQLKTHKKLFDVESSEDANAEINNPDERREGDTLSPVGATIALVIITVAVAICAEYLVDSIDDIVDRWHISKTFIGLILLPIVGNAAEHVTAVVVSWKDKMDLALSVAIGSSLQIAIFVTPFLVLLGWGLGQEMTLHFQTFETVVFFMSIFVVNSLIADGRSNYLEGCMCIGTYVIIALAFYVYPESSST